MKLICLEYAAFYALIGKVEKRLTDGKPKTEKWVSGQAMQMLRITSKATLQKFRDEGKIRFSQPEKKIILYDTDLIYEFVNKNARETF